MFTYAFECAFPYVSGKSCIICKNIEVDYLHWILRLGSQGLCEYESQFQFRQVRNCNEFSVG